LIREEELSMAMVMWQSANESLPPDDDRADRAMVATELRLASTPALRCPAAVLVAGELASLGVPTALGPVFARSPHVGEAHEPVFHAELGGGIGLGAAAPARWRPTVFAALASWLSVTGERTVLLPAPRSFCAGAAVAAEADLVLVIGSANSSNSVRLAEVARRCGTPAYLIDSAADIRASWLTGVRTIGLTAGASAPPSLIATIIAALEGLGPVRVRERLNLAEQDSPAQGTGAEENPR
jgi:hypothetical protein